MSCYEDGVFLGRKTREEKLGKRGLRVYGFSHFSTAYDTG